MPDKASRRIRKRLERQKQLKNDYFAAQPVLQPANDEDDYVIFSLKNLVKNYDLDNPACNDYIKGQLLDKLWKISQLTWENLIMQNKKSGFETVPRSIFRVALPSWLAEDIDKLYVLRFNGQNCRLIGYRSENVFYAIFIDVDLSVYRH